MRGSCLYPSQRRSWKSSRADLIPRNEKIKNDTCTGLALRPVVAPQCSPGFLRPDRVSSRFGSFRPGLTASDRGLLATGSPTSKNILARMSRVAGCGDDAHDNRYG